MSELEKRSDHDLVELAGGKGPVTEDHREIDARSGQQKGYVVLTAEERAKGFVRPVRRSYVHIGRAGPKHPLRDLTDDERERYSQYGYAKYEDYPKRSDGTPADDSSVLGKYWTQADLDAAGSCGAVTTMAQEIAETYARNPEFYSGTFCTRCREHRPLDEFLWEGTQEVVGS